MSNNIDKVFDTLILILLLAPYPIIYIYNLEKMAVISITFSFINALDFRKNIYLLVICIVVTIILYFQELDEYSYIDAVVFLLLTIGTSINLYKNRFLKHNK